MPRTTRIHLVDGSGVMLRATIAKLFWLKHQSSSLENKIAFLQNHGSSRVESLRLGYNVVTLGTNSTGCSVDTTLPVDFVYGAFSTSEHRREILDLVEDPRLQVIHTNQREDGFLNMEGSAFDDWPQPSLTARLVKMLFRRWEAKTGPITLVCWELILGNGPKMKVQLVEMAKRFELPSKFVTWLGGPEVWCPRNVQNIICVEATAKPHKDVGGVLSTVMEPIPMFGITIEEHPEGEEFRPFKVDHQNVAYLPGDQVDKIYQTKCYILNKLHVALVAKWIAEGLQCETVLEAMALPGIKDWLLELGRETIALHGDELVNAEAFLADVIRRFENPWLAHKLSAIAGGIMAKWDVRVQPTLDKIRKPSTSLLQAVHQQHLANLATLKYAPFQKK